MLKGPSTCYVTKGGGAYIQGAVTVREGVFGDVVVWWSSVSVGEVSVLTSANFF